MEFKEILSMVKVLPGTEYIKFEVEGQDKHVGYSRSYEVTFDKELKHKIQEKGKIFDYTGVLVSQYDITNRLLKESYVSVTRKMLLADTRIIYENDRAVGSERYEYAENGKIYKIEMMCDNFDSKYSDKLINIECMDN